AVLTVRTERDEEPGARLDLVRERLPELLETLARAGTTDADAWPRPFETLPDGARLAVGLGRNPPDGSLLAGITADWLGRLPGVEIGWAEGGAVPTLD
ncbi:polynucleotide adenylyltransferase, partial [Streptomyces sp. NPDC059233]